MSRALALVAPLLFALAACGGEATAPPAQAPAADGHGSVPARTVNLRPLTDDEVVRYIALLGEVRDIAKKRIAGEPTEDGPQAHSQMLQRHGFDPVTFRDVQQNVSRAYSAIKAGERAQALDQLRQEQAARAAASGAAPPAAPAAAAVPATEVPEVNVTLLLAHQAEFEDVAGAPKPVAPPVAPPPPAAAAPAPTP